MKNEEWGLMLIQLVKEHKKHCKKEACGISTFSLRELFEKLMDRETTQEEFNTFV